MLQLERQKLILEYLKQNRKATTNELSEMLGVSTTTIRTDLNQMDKEKLLTKTHGGALYHDNSADNKELTGKAYFFHERALENKKEKEAICVPSLDFTWKNMDSPSIREIFPSSRAITCCPPERESVTRPFLTEVTVPSKIFPFVRDRREATRFSTPFVPVSVSAPDEIA